MFTIWKVHIDLLFGWVFLYECQTARFLFKTLEYVSVADASCPVHYLCIHFILYNRISYNLCRLSDRLYTCTYGDEITNEGEYVAC